MEKNTEESSYKLFLNVGFIFFFLGGGIMKNSLKYQVSEGKTEGKTCMEDLHGRKHNQVPASKHNEVPASSSGPALFNAHIPGYQNPKCGVVCHKPNYEPSFNHSTALNFFKSE